MENNENLVVEQTAEKVEQTTEQTPKTYTQEEVDAMMGKRVARTEAKIRKEYQRKYGDLENVLKAGTGMETVEQITDTFKQHYQQNGVELPERPVFSEKDINVLADADAKEFINAGYEDVVEEVDRLNNLGADKMTDREKSVLKVLTEYRKNAERNRELAKLGVSEEVYTSKEFTEFAGKFESNIPMAEVYDLYKRTHPEKEYTTMGSMKSEGPGDSGVKDFYTVEEARKFTKADFDKNPELYAAVQRSMAKWK